MVNGRPFEVCTDWQSLPEAVAQAVADWEFVLNGAQILTSCTGSWPRLWLHRASVYGDFPCAENLVACTIMASYWDEARKGKYYVIPQIFVNDLDFTLQEPNGLRAVVAHELGHVFGLADAYRHDPIACNDHPGTETIMDAFAANNNTVTGGCDGIGLWPRDITDVQTLYALLPPMAMRDAYRGSSLLLEFFDGTRAEAGYQYQLYYMQVTGWQFVTGGYDIADVGYHDKDRNLSWTTRLGDPEGQWKLCLYVFSWVNGFQHWRCTNPAYLWPLDADGDGFTGWSESGQPLCQSAFPAKTLNGTVNEDWRDDNYPDDGCPRAGASAESGWQCGNDTNDDYLDDAVVNDGCPQVGAYSEASFNIGTLPYDGCGPNAWPADLYSNGASANRIDISDVLAYVAPENRISARIGDLSYHSRWDISPNGTIDITDLLNLVTIAPPMAPYYGSPAWSGPRCTP